MPTCPRHKVKLIELSYSISLINNANPLYECLECKKFSNKFLNNNNLSFEDKKIKLSYQWCIDSSKNIYFYYSGWHLYGKYNKPFIFR